MKLLAILLCALSLLSATAADARHHHRHAHHAAVPMPRERPVIKIGAQLRQGSDASGYTQRTQTTEADGPTRPSSVSTPLHSNAIAWWPSTSPWRADEAFSRAEWKVSQWP